MHCLEKRNRDIIRVNLITRKYEARWSLERIRGAFSQPLVENAGSVFPPFYHFFFECVDREKPPPPDLSHNGEELRVAIFEAHAYGRTRPGPFPASPGFHWGPRGEKKNRRWPKGSGLRIARPLLP